MADLRDQLQNTLSGTYTLERELGGGGMSRVFLAHELRLQRKVVVKVLSPELAAGISAERFEREIQLAASLQQANIVPVLTAGDTNGLPYFTMPFVEGESLRARLGKGGALSITEVVGILRDVAKALAYAHERGVVHRDIKPDNVLISGGTAVVTDFGIAKALSASRTESGSTTLTQLGTSIGTPAYMSPEQAAGDPDIDHRADIYAFGCTAYELLAGKPPFTERTPQRILAAQMGETPKPINELRLDTPPALAQLVMECLAKDPDSRPQRAADVARVLDTVTSGTGPAMPPVLLGGRAMMTRALMIYAAAFVVVAVLARAAIIVIGLPNWVFPGALIVMALGLPVILFTGYAQRTTMRAITSTPALTPGGSRKPHGTMATLAIKASPHMSWRRTAIGGAWALGVFVVLVGGFMVMRAFGIGPAGSLIGAGKLSDQDQILVADFKATGADSASGGALAELMRSSLQQSNAVRLMPASAVAGALERMKLPSDSKIDLALAQQMARREGVKAIVTGDVTPLAGGSIVTVKLLAASSGDVLWSAHRSVNGAAEFVPAMDELARELRGKIGESLRAVQGAPALARVTTTSMEALQKFTEGAHATDVEGDEPKAIRLLDQAIALDSTFAMAYRKLSIAITNNNVQIARAADVLEKGMKYVDQLPEAERLAYMARYHGLVNTAHHDRVKAVAEYEELFRRFPEWKRIITETLLANEYGSRQEWARAESLNVEIMKVAPDEWAPYTNIINTQIALGKYPEVRQSLARDRARKPGDPTADLFEGELHYNLGQRDSARILWERASRTSNTRRAVTGRFNLGNLDMSEGRIAEALRERSAARALNVSIGAAPQSAFAESLDMATLSIVVFDKPAEAVKQLAAAVQVAGKTRTPSLRLVTLYAMAGKPDSAKAELARYDASVTDTAARRRGLNARQAANAWIELAEAKYQDAIAEFRQSDRLPDGPLGGCQVCIDAGVGSAFDRAGMKDSAIMVFEHFVNTPSSIKSAQDPINLPWILRRLGELYEAKGDHAKAIVYYQRFVDLWKNADPELQPKVNEIRQRLAQLKNTDRPK